MKEKKVFCADDLFYTVHFLKGAHYKSKLPGSSPSISYGDRVTMVATMGCDIFTFGGDWSFKSLLWRSFECYAETLTTRLGRICF